MIFIMFGVSRISCLVMKERKRFKCLGLGLKCDRSYAEYEQHLKSHFRFY